MVCEEIFGLVLVISVFDFEDEVICLVNDSCYGFVVLLWSDDLYCVYWVVWCLNVGMVLVNIVDVLDVVVFFGGGK